MKCNNLNKNGGTMDFKLASLLMIVFCVLGCVVTYNVVDQEADIKVITLPAEEKIVNHTEFVEKPVADTSLILDKAVEDFLSEVQDESDLRRCDGDKYSFSEISKEEVEDEYIISIDDEDFSVEFELELRYKESDLRSCYETYNVLAEYELDEDTDFSY